MLHTLVQAQSGPRATEFLAITCTLCRALLLIHDLCVSHEAIATVTLSAILGTEVVAASTRTGAAFNSHAVVTIDRGGEHSVGDMVGVAALVTIVGDGRVDRNRDVCIRLEDRHAVGAAAGLA